VEVVLFVNFGVVSGPIYPTRTMVKYVPLTSVRFDQH
jgi:hypothetical protein